MILVEREFPFSDNLAEDTQDFLTAYLKRFKSIKTQRNYCLAINEFSDYIKKDLCSVTKEDVTRYILHLESRRNVGQLKNSTIVKKKFQLSGVFTVLATPHARETLNLPDSFDNFFLDVQLDRGPDTLKYEKIPSLDELDALHNFLSENDPMIDIAFLLAFKGFLTTEEFRTLTISNFFMDASGKMVVQIQNPSYPLDVRYNSIPEDVKDIFLSYFDSLETMFDEPPIYLFGKKDGSIYTARSLCLKLRDACDSCLMKRYTFNDFRNAGTVYAKAYHADVSVIANSLGYKTNRHIGRLESLQVTVNDAADLVGIYFKPTTKQGS